MLTCRFSGHFKDFVDAELDKIRDREIDLVIRLGGHGIYRGEILSVAPYGLISIHHGDNRKYRGGPPGFWEIMNDDPVCGFIVQRLTDVLDHGEILARKTIATPGYAALARKTLYDEADKSLANTVTYFVTNGRLPAPESAVHSAGPIYRMPGLLDIMFYLLKTTRRRGWARSNG